MEPLPAIESVRGGALASDADVVVQICDCVSLVASGFAARVAARWPYAQVYSWRRPVTGSLGYATPGDVYLALPPGVAMSSLQRRVPVCHEISTSAAADDRTLAGDNGSSCVSRDAPVVACVVSFWHDKSAALEIAGSTSAGACPKGEDTVDNRLLWFAQALRKLRGQLSRLAIRKVAFPSRLGHAHADTVACITCAAWRRYMEVIRAFADAAPFQVAVVDDAGRDVAAVGSAPFRSAATEPAGGSDGGGASASPKTEAAEGRCHIDGNNACVSAKPEAREDTALSAYRKRRHTQLAVLAAKKKKARSCASPVANSADIRETDASGVATTEGHTFSTVTPANYDASVPSHVGSGHAVVAHVRHILSDVPSVTAPLDANHVPITLSVVASGTPPLEPMSWDAAKTIEDTEDGGEPQIVFPPFPARANGELARDKAATWTYAEDCWMEQCLASLTATAAVACRVPPAAVHASLCAIVKFPHVAEGNEVVVRRLRDGLHVLAALARRTLGATEARAWHLIGGDPGHALGQNGNKTRTVARSLLGRATEAATAGFDERRATTDKKARDFYNHLPPPPSPSPPTRLCPRSLVAASPPTASNVCSTATARVSSASSATAMVVFVEQNRETQRPTSPSLYGAGTLIAKHTPSSTTARKLAVSASIAATKLQPKPQVSVPRPSSTPSRHNGDPETAPSTRRPALHAIVPTTGHSRPSVGAVVSPTRNRVATQIGTPDATSTLPAPSDTLDALLELRGTPPLSPPPASTERKKSKPRRNIPVATPANARGVTFLSAARSRPPPVFGAGTRAMGPEVRASPMRGNPGVPAPVCTPITRPFRATSGAAPQKIQSAFVTTRPRGNSNGTDVKNSKICATSGSNDAIDGDVADEDRALSPERVIVRRPEHGQTVHGKLFRKFASTYPTARLYLESPVVVTTSPSRPFSSSFSSSSSPSSATAFAPAHPWKSRSRPSL